MGLKYFIEYYNISNDFIRIEISQKGFKGTALEVFGKATITQASVNNIFSPIRGMGMTLDLEANKDLDFTDLYSESETDFKVSLSRNNQVIFLGFIKPDGIWSDFVRDNWIISLDCIDGLGVLKNLRFINEEGGRYVGLMTEEEIIRVCLKRTSLDLPINSRIMLRPYGAENIEVSVLAKIRLHTERFYKDAEEEDDKEIMDCEEILKSILEKYNAVIQQHNGEWYIFRPRDIIHGNTDDGLENSFFRYKKGELLRLQDTKTQYKIGSNINGFFPHHAGENQRIEIKGGAGAFRAKFDYGLLLNLIQNPTFEVGDDNIPFGWGAFTPKFTPIKGGGLEWKSTRDDSLKRRWNNGFYELRQLDNIIVEKGDSFKLKLNALTVGWMSYFPVVVTLYSNRGYKYLVDNEWSVYTGYTKLGDYIEKTAYCNNKPQQQFIGTGVEYDFSLQTPPVDDDGYIFIQILRPHLFQPNDDTFPCAQINTGMNLRYPESYAKLYSFEIEPSDEAKEREGETHTAYRVPFTSTDVEEPLEVFNGDLVTDVYAGVMKLRSGKNTTTWQQIGVDEQKELLQIMAMDRIKLQYKAQKVFSGGVFGYLPSFSIITIDKIDGRFLPTSFSWDSQNDLCNFVLNELFAPEDYAGDIEEIIQYEKKYSRGKVIKPTIAG